jgi:hypothetical protein
MGLLIIIIILVLVCRTRTLLLLDPQHSTPLLLSMSHVTIYVACTQRECAWYVFDDGAPSAHYIPYVDLLGTGRIIVIALFGGSEIHVCVAGQRPNKILR